ncbi:MAG: peroxiredoxin [Thermoguttaceae bacterium]
MDIYGYLGVILLTPVAAMAFFGQLKAAELKVGDVAPDFKLLGSDGKTYHLADFRGKQTVLLAWFPKAFTPGCTKECKAFAAGGASLRKFNVAYFTASVDSPEKNKKFAASLGADFPILSDADGKVARSYGVTGPIQKFASRWTFYIGKDGKILFIDKGVHVKTHADDVAKKLEELGVEKNKVVKKTVIP